MYFQNIPRKTSIQHQNTRSSNGVVTTPGANHEIVFGTVDAEGKPLSGVVLNFLEIFADSADMNVKINDESNSHFIKNGEGKEFSEIQIIKLTIIEAGVDYHFSGALY